MVNSKHAFWQAFVFAIIVFALGLVLGFFLEIKQNDNVFSKLVDSEINILDDQLRSRVIGDFDVNCGVAKTSLFSFADKIYEEALELEQMDTDGRLNDLTTLHRRYDLLRTLLWLEGQELKVRCGEDFHTLVYLYEYNSEDIDQQGKQMFYSRLLFDLKSEDPENIMLIPVAVDTGLSSVDLIVQTKEIETFPAIIVDNSKEVYDILTLDDLRNLVSESNESSQ